MDTQHSVSPYPVLPHNGGNTLFLTHTVFNTVGCGCVYTALQLCNPYIGQELPYKQSIWSRGGATVVFSIHSYDNNVGAPVQRDMYQSPHITVLRPGNSPDGLGNHHLKGTWTNTESGNRQSYYLRNIEGKL